MLSNKAVMERRLSMPPLRRPGIAQEVVGGALFLVGPARKFVTGHNLVVDAGTTISDGS